MHITYTCHFKEHHPGTLFALALIWNAFWLWFLFFWDDFRKEEKTEAFTCYFKETQRRIVAAKTLGRNLVGILLNVAIISILKYERFDNGCVIAAR